MARARKIVAPEASPDNRRASLVDQDPDTDRVTPAHRRALDRQEERNAPWAEREKFLSVSDRVAGDSICFRNYKWPGANEAYPDDPDAMMRFVTKYYPHAIGGPLYIDQPKSNRQVEQCEEKRKVMKKLRLRYVVVAEQYQTPDGMMVPSTNLAEALEQLE